MLTVMVAILFITPTSVNVVAAVCCRHHHPAYEMPLPTTQLMVSATTAYAVRYGVIISKSPSLLLLLLLLLLSDHSPAITPRASIGMMEKVFV